MTNTSKFDIIAVAVSTGDYSVDCARGRDMADRFIADIESPIELGAVVSRIAARGKFNGVHAGFMHRLSERLMALADA